MSRFFYRVRDAESGNLLEGYIQANSRQEAITSLRKERYLIIDLKYYDIIAAGKDYWRRWQRRRINTEFLLILCRQLAILLNAGISIVAAVKILREEMQAGAQRDFLTETLNKLNEGSSLSEIWRKPKGLVPSYIINSLVTAEHTGMLAKSFAEAAQILAKNHEQRKKLRQICIYPAFLLMVLAIICSIMLFFVLPTFADIFQKMHLELPLLTRAILFIGATLRQNIGYIICFGAIALIAVIKGWQQPKIQFKLTKLLFKLPIIGTLLEKIYVLQISRQLMFLLSSGVDIDMSFTVITASMDNMYIKERLQNIQQSMHRGLSLSMAFRRSGFSQQIFLSLLNVGEQTGMLADNLAYSVDFLSKDMDAFIAEFMQLLEPLLMIVVGIIIGLFVLAIILPLFSLTSGLSL